ncbi:MAG: GNAT family N-acetyltransferase [Candidatus Pacebacteria bacterium]|nr:GNAT family N-acetyltransferase [Candidatus Paceibacterota bacterium]
MKKHATANASARGSVTISTDRRLLDPADAAALYIELGWGTSKKYSAARMKRSLANCDIVIFALNGAGEPVALLRALTDHALETKILDLVIVPEYQRQGIGLRIMKKLAVEAKGTSIYLETAKKNFAFAERCGYEKRKGLTVFKHG